MASFKDNRGDLWEVPFTFREVLRIKSALGIDLTKIAESKAPNDDFDKLAGDFEQMINVIFLCCEGQAKERGVSDVDFAGRLDLAIFGDALDAFASGFLDFFLKGPTRERGRALMAKRSKLVEKQVEAERENALKALESFVSDSSSPASAE